MRRKLIKQGIGALTITLPKEWISQYNLEAGDEIEIEENNKNLLLIAEGKSGTLTKTEINIDGMDQFLIWRYLISLYRLGYDEITLTFSDINKKYDIKLSSLGSLERKIQMRIIEVIKDIVNRFIGFEIIDQGKYYCILKNLSENSEKEFDNTLRRIFLLLLSMAEESLVGLNKKTKNIRNSVRDIDVNIDKLTDFCLRILNKLGHKKIRKTNSIYAIILLLELIGDEFKRIAFHVSEFSERKKFGHGIISIHGQVNRVLDLLYKLFYKFSKERIVEIYDLDEQLTKKINSLNFNNEEKEILHHLKKIKRHVTDLLQLIIEMEV